MSGDLKGVWENVTGISGYLRYSERQVQNPCWMCSNKSKHAGGGGSGGNKVGRSGTITDSRRLDHETPLGDHRIFVLSSE